MDRATRLASLLLAACAVAAAPAAARLPASGADGAGGAPGAPIGPCEFVDVRFVRRTLEDFGARRAFVLAFFTVGCPVAARNFPKLARLAAGFDPRDVQFVAVDVGAGDTVVEAAAHALDCGASFPVVRDHELSTARACGVTRAGEVVVLDGERRLRYRGRVDAQQRASGATPAPVRDDLALALAELLDGRAPAVAQTPPEGCLLTPPPRPTEGITWSRQVRPLLERACVECHRPGGAAPFALLDAASAQSHAAMIAEVVELGRMPPWHAARAHGEFRNERGLNADERRLLIDWAATGAARGDPDAPPIEPPPAPADWKIGAPDLVLTAPGEVELPADGIVPYQYAVLPHVFLEETWVEAVEIRPRNPRVMHHCNLAYVEVGESFRQENFITGQVPGGDPLDLGPGIAVRLPAGSLLALQVHYVTTGRPERDRIEVALRFPKRRVEKQLRHFQIADTRFAIPPGHPAWPVRAQARFDVDAVGIGMFVHMHRRGRDLRFIARPPEADATPETLLLVAAYDFDWQASYRWFPGRRRFAAGTRVECVAHFDNSPFNAWNPDPAATVRFGQQTEHEMMYGFLFWVAAGERLRLDVDPATGRAR